MSKRNPFTGNRTHALGTGTLWLLILSLLVSLALPLAAMGETTEEAFYETGLTTQPPEVIAEAIENYVAEHEDTMVGLMVTVFDGEKTLYENYFGYANKETGLAADAETVMEWGSITKLLTWVSVMQQVEAGRIDLDADIRRYLPEGFLTKLKYEQPITMVNLMSHNAGFEEVLIGNLLMDESMVQPLGDHLYQMQPRQAFEPGAVTAYSNFSTALAGYIVELVSGQPFDEYVHEHIFAPLSMEDAALNGRLTDNPAVREKRSTLGYYNTKGDPIDGEVWQSGYPNGGCVSTLRDLTAFGQALSRREEALLSAAGWETFFSPSTWHVEGDVPANSHGLWWHELGVSVMGHGGNTVGCSSHLLFDPVSGVGIALMTNQGGEMVFNYGLPQVLWGSCTDGDSGYTGFIRSARTIYSGPLKCYSMICTQWCSESDLGLPIAVYEISQPVPRLTAVYGDYLTMTTGQLLPDLITFGLYALACLFCAGTLLCKLIRTLCRRDGQPFGTWNSLMSLLMIAPMVIFICISCTFFSGNEWPYAMYKLASAAIGLMLIGLVIGLVYGFVKRKKPQTTRQKVFHWVMMACVLAAVAFIVYWDAYAFWMM